MKDYFLNVKLDRCDFGQNKISPKGMVRLIASGKNFYLNESDFVDSLDFIKCLKQGDELKICAELLNDGSFWVKWIYHETKGRLEPERTFILTVKQKAWLLAAFILTIMGCGWSYFSLFYLDDVNFFIIVSMVISFGAVMTGVSYIGEKAYRYFQRIRPKHKKIINALDKVMAKQDVIAPDGEQLIIPEIKTRSLLKHITHKNPTVHIKQSKVQRIRGKIKLHHVDRIQQHHRHGESVVMQISCQIDKYLFTLSYKERLFYFDHNLFLADGDDVELFFWQAEDKNSPSVVSGVYNHTDNGAYSISGILHQRAKFIGFLMAAGVGLFIFSIFTFLKISDIYEGGNYWDKWDWLSLCDDFLGMGIMYALIIMGFTFFTALFSNLYILLSQKGNSSYQTYFLLQQQCFENKKTLYITELSR